MNANRPPPGREGQAGIAQRDFGNGGDRSNVLLFPSDRVTRNANRRRVPEPEYLGWLLRVGQASREARSNPSFENLEALEALAREGAQWTR
jgi:hypothetical protein